MGLSAAWFYERQLRPHRNWKLELLLLQRSAATSIRRGAICNDPVAAISSEWWGTGVQGRAPGQGSGSTKMLGGRVPPRIAAPAMIIL